MKAENWCYGILITIVLAVFIFMLSGFCFPGTFTGTITELTDTYFTLQSTEPGVQAQAAAVKWPDTPAIEIGDTVTVRYYRKTHGTPMGLYIYKMEVKAEAEVDSSASASVEYGENQSEVRVKQGGEYYRLYQMTVYSYGYVEEADSFAADTGPRLRNLVPDETEEFPVIAWAEDFSLDVPEDLWLYRIDVYDENGEEVNLFPEEKPYEENLKEYRQYISKLPCGTYYVGAEVYREGSYIEEKGEHNYSGEQYVFCLEKDRKLKKEEQEIPYIKDGSADWSTIAEIEIYAEGCAMPPTTIISETQTIEKIIEAVCKTGDYSKVSEEQQLEGMMNIWVKFDNGVVIGMYKDENYGYIGTELDVVGTAPFYHFPEQLYQMVWEYGCLQ